MAKSKTIAAFLRQEQLRKINSFTGGDKLKHTKQDTGFLFMEIKHDYGLHRVFNASLSICHTGKDSGYKKQTPVEY